MVEGRLAGAVRGVRVGLALIEEEARHGEDVRSLLLLPQARPDAGDGHVESRLAALIGRGVLASGRAERRARVEGVRGRREHERRVAVPVDGVDVDAPGE